ncbi:MAG: hypothetical protein GXO86_10830 [Chlorobi bacterium]|nr:hypothetical protein [Chlorobiota bacterium]
MKRIKLLLLTLIFPVLLSAQGIEIVPFAGYMFGGSISFIQGKLKVEDGMNYGGSLIIPIREVVDLELNWTGMDSRAVFTPYSNYPDFKYEETGLSTNYFQIGVLKAFNNNPKIRPFGSFSMGATLFNLKEYADTWRFSITAGLGVKFMFSDHVGIMLRGRLMMPMYFAGVGGYIGIGTGGAGAGLTLNSYATLFQGDFNGGLIIKLGN